MLFRMAQCVRSPSIEPPGKGTATPAVRAAAKQLPVLIDHPRLGVDQWRPWDHIYPRVKGSTIAPYNSSGKYGVRLFWLVSLFRLEIARCRAVYRHWSLGGFCKVWRRSSLLSFTAFILNAARSVCLLTQLAHAQLFPLRPVAIELGQECQRTPATLNATCTDEHTCKLLSEYGHMRTFSLQLQKCTYIFCVDNTPSFLFSFSLCRVIGEKSLSTIWCHSMKMVKCCCPLLHTA